MCNKLVCLHFKTIGNLEGDRKKRFGRHKRNRSEKEGGKVVVFPRGYYIVILESTVLLLFCVPAYRLVFEQATCINFL